MKTFKDYSGEQAIDMVMEAGQYITPIISDIDIMGSIDKSDIGRLGAKALKKYPEECQKIREILGNEPADSAIGAAYGIAQVLIEVICDKDIIDFFKSMSKTLKQSTSATESGKEEA